MHVDNAVRVNYYCCCPQETNVVLLLTAKQLVKQEVRNPDFITDVSVESPVDIKVRYINSESNDTTILTGNLCLHYYISVLCFL